MLTTKDGVEQKLITKILLTNPTIPCTFAKFFKTEKIKL